jgi:hypothetical protein
MPSRRKTKSVGTVPNVRRSEELGREILRGRWTASLMWLLSEALSAPRARVIKFAAMLNLFTVADVQIFIRVAEVYLFS